MKIPRLKILQYKLRDTEGNVTYNPTTITRPMDVDIKAGIENNKDTFTFKTLSHRTSDTGSWDTKILRKTFSDNDWNKGDFVSIYAWHGAIEPTQVELDDNHLLLYGVVDTFDTDIGEKGAQISIKGANSTEELLNTMVPFSSLSDTGSFNTSPKAIQFMINQRLHRFNPKRKVYAYLDNETNPYTGSPGQIASTKQNGTAFPTIDYAKTWTPIYKQIEELSTSEYTGDIDSGTYQNYIVPRRVIPSKVSEVGSIINELVWKPKSKDITGSYREHDDFYTAKLSWDVREIYNAFIFNAGTDFNGIGIIDIVLNTDSMGKYGAKWKYYAANRQMFSDLATTEKQFGIGAGSTFDDNGPYPDQLVAGSNWTFAFDGRDGTGLSTGSKAIATSRKEYNLLLATEAKWRVKNIAQEVVDTLGEPRFRVEANMVTGSNIYQMGDLYTLLLPSIGWEGTEENPGYNLRLVDINHKLNREGWSTTCVFEEDEYTISQLAN